MSTATKSPASDAQHPRYVDYDEFIDFQVQKTRAGIKANDLLTALIGASVVMLAYVLIFAILDHWVVDGGFSRGVRIGLLSALLIGLGVWFVWKLVIPYFRRISALYAAREIEDAEPAFRSTLLTLVDLKQAGRNVSPEIRAVLEKRAGLGLTHMNVEQAVDRRLLMRLSYALLALVVLTCVYAIASPKKLSNSLWRSLLPTSAVAVDTRTRIERIDPGHTDVLARSQLPVSVELSGVMPEDVTLYYTTADRRLVDEPVALRQTDDGIRQYRGIITGENGRGILQSLTYFVVAGDARSDSFTVTVSTPPSATVDEVAYEFPKYMGLRDRVQIGGAIDAWEGTWVTIRATTNMPVHSALVMFSDSDDVSQKAEELPVEIENGNLLTARWQLRIRSDGTFPNFYRIQCRTESGKTDPAPALHPIKIRPDLPPRIQLVQPTTDLERPANAVVPLLYAAQDPDFLLRSVTVRMERNGEVLPQSPRLYEGPPFRKSVTGTHELALEPLALQPGDKLTYWLEARDNLEPFADRSGNRSNTPRLNITITEPAPHEEVEQQLQDDRQQVEERLEAARQEPASDDSPEPTPAEPGDPGDDSSPQAKDDAAASDRDRDDPPQQEQTEQAGGEQDGDQSQPDSSSPSDRQPQEGQSGTSGKQEQPGEGPQDAGASDSPGEKDGTGKEDVPFDDLLKQLMQRERQQSEQKEGRQSDKPESGEQTETDRPEDSERPSTGEAQSTEQQESSGARPEPATDTPQKESPESASDAHQEGGAEESTTPSPGQSKPSKDGTGPSSQSGESANSPQPGDGTDPSQDTANPAVREGETKGGRPSNDETPSDATPANGDPSDAQNEDGARREPTSDSEQSETRPTLKEGDPSSSSPSSDQPPENGTRPQHGETPQTPPSGSQSADKAQQTDDAETPQQGTPGEQESSPKDQDAPKSGSARDGTASDRRSDAEERTAEDELPSKESEPHEGSSPQGSNGTPSPTDPTGGEPSGSDSQPPESKGQSTPQSGNSESEQQPGGEKDSGGEESGGDSSGDQKSGGTPSGRDGGQSGKTEQQGNNAGGNQEGGSPQGGTPSEGAQGTRGGGSSATGDREAAATPVDGSGGGEPSKPGPGGGEGPSDSIEGDAPDLEAKKKAANLILKRLQDQLQRGEIDPALREELGITEDQMREFTQRLQQRLSDTGEDLSPEAQARRRQFEETLKNIQYESAGTERAGGDGPREASGGFAGPQRKAPLNRRNATQEYRERFSRQSGGVP